MKLHCMVNTSSMHRCISSSFSPFLNMRATLAYPDRFLEAFYRTFNDRLFIELYPLHARTYMYKIFKCKQHNIYRHFDITNYSFNQIYLLSPLETLVILFFTKWSLHNYSKREGYAKYNNCKFQGSYLKFTFQDIFNVLTIQCNFIPVWRICLFHQEKEYL